MPVTGIDLMFMTAFLLVGMLVMVGIPLWDIANALRAAKDAPKGLKDVDDGL